MPVTLVLLGAFAAGLARAQKAPERLDIWSLLAGQPATAQPHDFIDFACGGNGGPPSITLSGFHDFRRCRPEADGLREVYFRYDDELEYRAKALGNTIEVERWSGTKEYGFPVIVSALFNEAGALLGLRIVSDARDPSRRREDAHSLANFITARFGREGWDCVDHAPAEGESPVGRGFVKRDCVKRVAGGVARVETRYFRKRGQEEFDPRSGRETSGQFESVTRFELRMPG